MPCLNRMWVTQGEKIRSKLNGAVYTVNTINTTSVILESADGWKQEYKNTERLEYFFEKVKYKKDYVDKL
jgi:hypothetical protein